MEPILGKNKLCPGKIHSINISKMKGVSKGPVKAAELLVDFGVKGDAHAGPGIRQVSLLALESIEKQMSSSEVARSGVNLKPGDFAENITTKGLSLMDLQVGTMLTIGNDVVIEISKIGKDCHKRCAIYYKTGDCIMPKEGIFAKVLKGGEIAIGDEMEVVNNENRSKKAKS